VAAVTYSLCLRNGGTPAAGLSPAWLLFRRLADDASPTLPALAAVAGGLYKFTYDAEDQGDAHGVLDAGASVADPAERYRHVVCRRGDAPALTAAETESAVWDAVREDHATAGSFGEALDVPVSSRSDYAGGPVQSVTDPVTVGSISDTTGFKLAEDGLDAALHRGRPFVDWLDRLLAVHLGRSTGFGTSTVTFFAAHDPNTVAVESQVDPARPGDRVAVSLPDLDP
jgi:hypothetical protein